MNRSFEKVPLTFEYIETQTIKDIERLLDAVVNSLTKNIPRGKPKNKNKNI